MREVVVEVTYLAWTGDGGQFPVHLVSRLYERGQFVSVVGRKPGEHCVVTEGETGREGRRRIAETALLGEGGSVIAVGVAAASELAFHWIFVPAGSATFEVTADMKIRARYIPHGTFNAAG